VLHWRFLTIYFGVDKGKRAFAEWKTKQQEVKETPSHETVEGEASNALPFSHILMSLINLTKPNASPMGISLGFG
jgi:hypothetical protein